MHKFRLKSTCKEYLQIQTEEKSNMYFLHNTQYKYRLTKIYDLDMLFQADVDLEGLYKE